MVVVFGNCGAFGVVLHEESIRGGTEDGVRSVLCLGTIGTVRVVPTVVAVVAGTMFDTDGSGCDSPVVGYDVVAVTAAVDGTQHRTVSKRRVVDALPVVALAVVVAAVVVTDE